MLVWTNESIKKNHWIDTTKEKKKIDDQKGMNKKSLKNSVQPHMNHSIGYKKYNTHAAETFCIIFWTLSTSEINNFFFQCDEKEEILDLFYWWTAKGWVLADLIDWHWRFRFGRKIVWIKFDQKFYTAWLSIQFLNNREKFMNKKNP